MEPRYVYRLLNNKENPEHGLRAKNPNAQLRLVDHVANGSGWGFASQFISTCANFEAVQTFAKKSMNPVTRIVKINIDLLKQVPGVRIIDLSTSASREQYLEKDVDHETYQKAVNFANKFSEVVIVGDIPPNCIEMM